MDGTRNCSDATAIAFTQKLKAQTRKAVRYLVASECPAHADRLADFIMMTLSGLSAAARDGMKRNQLTNAAQIAADAVASRLNSNLE